MSSTFFLHGLDSSNHGTKGKYFTTNFDHVICPNFSGNLDQRIQQLSSICSSHDDLTLIGSSYGGLMATCYAIDNPLKVKKLVLLAPALNFENYSPPTNKINTPTLLVVGEDDTVTPPKEVVPLAKKSFSELEIIMPEDDHMLHRSFPELDWKAILEI